MIEQILTFLQVNIIPLGGFGIFLATLIEEILWPIPAAFVLLASGFLFLTHTSGISALIILIFKIAIPAAFGVTLGSLFIYYLAYVLGRLFIDKYGKWFGLKWADIEKTEKWLERGLRDDVLIFIARATPIIPSVTIGAFAGIFRLPLRTYIISSFLGTFVRAVIVGLIGWQVGNLYWKYAEIIGNFENYILISVLTVFLSWILYRISRNRKINKDI